jgi:hypothetical protein
MDGTANPFSWQDELGQWTKTSGLQNYLQTGLQDSTIGKSGFFDQATAQAQDLRAKNLALAQQAIGQAPVAGIDPAQAVAATQAANAQALQQREAARQAGYGLARANQQSATDWINQMMGSTSQAVNKQQQEWQNYQQAAMQAAAQNQASQNALIGAGIGAAGTIAGSALAGPVGGALVGGLASAGAKSAMGGGGTTPASAYTGFGQASASQPNYLSGSPSFAQAVNPASQYFGNPFSNAGITYFGNKGY